MKTISLLFFISIFINNVFGDEVKSVSVMEGDNLTLHTDFTDTQSDDVTIVWTFGSQKSTIAKINREPKGNKISINDDVLDGRFRDRLQMNNQTGDLIITNITTQHTGVYEVEITVSSKIIQKSFNVNGVSNPESDQLKSVSVKDGDSVTLHTDVPDINKYDLIQWRFKGIRIAHINKSASEISEDDDIHDQRFRDKLQLDVQTGSLKIKNIRTDLSGLYEVDITIGNSYTIHQPFTVTVSGEVKSVSVMKGDTLTIFTDVPDIKTYDRILFFGNDDKQIADVNKLNKQFTLYGRIREGLKLNDQTGDLTITDITTADAGHYELKMSSRRRTIQRRFSVNISERGLSPGAIAGISVFFIMLIAAGGAAAGVIYYRRKKAKPKHQPGETKPSQADEEESKPLQADAGESNPSQANAGELKPSQTYAGESKPSQTYAGESKPSQTYAGESKPSQADEGESKPSQANVGESKQSQVNVGESKQSQVNVGESKPEGMPSFLIDGISQLSINDNYLVNGGEKVKEETHTATASPEKMENVSVTEGMSYTLKNNLTEIKTVDVIEWIFNETLIAEINPVNNIFSTSNDDLFRDKLKLNHQTGDLTINNITQEHTGVYKLKITRDGKTSYKTISVSVKCEIKTVFVDEGESVNLKTEVTDIQRVELIEWRFKETLIAEINPANNIFTTSNDDLYRNKLKLNRQTGDLNINDITEKHTGVYKLKITKVGKTSDRTFRVIVKDE